MTVEERIAAMKAQQSKTDRGLPPYVFPEHVAADDARRAALLKELRAK